MNTSRFIGRNIARFKFAQNYFILFFSMITALSTLTLALDISVIYIFTLLPIIVIIIWSIGYVIDKKGILKNDLAQSIPQQLKGQKYNTKIIWEEIVIPQMKEMFKEILKELIKERGAD